MSRKHLSETDICAKYITPALHAAGWDESQIRREDFAPGRIIVRGRLVTRGKPRRADYVLYYHHIAVALIEAKDATHAVGDGMQQALGYAESLKVPFVFSSNGRSFLFHDRTGNSPVRETELPLTAFPGPDELWNRYRVWKGLEPAQEKLVLQPYHEGVGKKEPRYYQRNAINATVEAISRGQNRLLLVMATGTGKTYVAFQIIWRLWKAGLKKRILFLADRNVLIDQTMVNDFRPFAGKMAKLSTSSKTIERADGTAVDVTLALDSKRRIDTSYEIYLGLYQALTGPEESDKLFKEFSRGFFDLIVIDECHRGSAAEDSAWREILDHFDTATQIGLTATPRETEYVSNMNYFGAPVYSYSLKQGINDGFLAPYKVIKVHLDVDVEGYRPAPGERDRHGHEIEDRQYNPKDYDRTLVIDERTLRVARWISAYLKESGDRMQKTIVFCVDTEHAARMRQALINENADLVAGNERYVMRITGNDPDGAAQIGNFIDPESPWPVLVTTSKLLSTGVDAQTCRLIVLDREVGSMTEFKQILGRGTRVNAEAKKYYFTLVDFRRATNHFADPDFDGEPVQIYEPGEEDSPVPSAEEDTSLEADDGLIQAKPGLDEIVLDGYLPGIDGQHSLVSEPPPKYYINGAPVKVLTERVEYLDEGGKLITESLRDYSRKTIRNHYGSLDQFLRRLKSEERKGAIIAELEVEGLPLDPLMDEVGKDLDPFDLICHIAFDRPPLTRKQRAATVRRKLDIFSRYGDVARAVLEALLAKYEDEGVVEGLDEPSILSIPPFSSLGTPFQLMKQFGDRAHFEQAVHDMQAALYGEIG